MDKKLKAKWVKALRSGRYKQGDGFLKDDDGRYCCLGVLAAIQGAEWDNGRPTIAGEDVGTLSFLSLSAAGGLRRSTQKNLAHMNDGGGNFDGIRQSFSQIADYIDKRL